MKNISVRFPVFVWLVTAAACWVLGGCQNHADSVHRSGDLSHQTAPPPPPPPAPRAPGQGDSILRAGVYTYVENMPSFPGGQSAMMRYLSEHIHYPASAREDGHQGTVVVQFDVQRDGSLRHIMAVGTPDSALAAEAVRVVTGMPRWNPGRNDSGTVVVQYSLPIRFVLQ